MISRGPDPLTDFYRWDAERLDYEEKCPVCDSCGEPITDETYIETEYKGKILRFHKNCIETQYTSHYIEEKEGFQV